MKFKKEMFLKPEIRNQLRRTQELNVLSVISAILLLAVFVFSFVLQMLGYNIRNSGRDIHTSQYNLTIALSNSERIIDEMYLDGVSNIRLLSLKTQEIEVTNEHDFLLNHSLDDNLLIKLKSIDITYLRIKNGTK